MKPDIIIFGGGGHARVIVDLLQEQQAQVIAVIDEKYEGDLLGIRRLKNLPEKIAQSTLALIAIGDNKVRQRMSESVLIPFGNATHPTAVISRYASIGKGCMIVHRAIIQAGAKIGDHVIVNTAAQVDHDCIVGNFAHLAPGCILCGSVSVGEGTLVGAGAVIKPGVRIGAWAIIGSGTVVLKDVPDFAVVVGNPGRILKYSRE